MQNRRSIRLKEYDYSQSGAYFVTVCTHNRECLFGEIADGEMVMNDAGRIVQAVWDTLPARFPELELDAFVVMPNHIHGIIAITNVRAIHELPLPPNDPMYRRRMLLPKIIGYAKMNTAKHINQSRNTHGNPVWHCNYYEHVIRDENELNDVLQYIVDNPAKWDTDEENPHAKPSKP